MARTIVRIWVDRTPASLAWGIDDPIGMDGRTDAEILDEIKRTIGYAAVEREIAAEVERLSVWGALAPRMFAVTVTLPLEGGK